METTQSLSTMGDLLHLAHVALEGNWVWPDEPEGSGWAQVPAPLPLPVMGLRLPL